MAAAAILVAGGVFVAGFGSLLVGGALLARPARERRRRSRARRTPIISAGRVVWRGGVRAAAVSGRTLSAGSQRASELGAAAGYRLHRAARVAWRVAGELRDRVGDAVVDGRQRAWSRLRPALHSGRQSAQSILRAAAPIARRGVRHGADAVATVGRQAVVSAGRARTGLHRAMLSEAAHLGLLVTMPPAANAVLEPAAAARVEESVAAPAAHMGEAVLGTGSVEEDGDDRQLAVEVSTVAPDPAEASGRSGVASLADAAGREAPALVRERAATVGAPGEPDGPAEEGGASPEVAGPEPATAQAAALDAGAAEATALDAAPPPAAMPQDGALDGAASEAGPVIEAPAGGAARAGGASTAKASRDRERPDPNPDADAPAPDAEGMNHDAAPPAARRPRRTTKRKHRTTPPKGGRAPHESR